MTPRPDVVRVELARIRDFTRRQAGQERRRRLTDHGHAVLAAVWQGAVGARPEPGVALAAVGSLARGDPGPLSDYDLVLLHDGRSRDDSQIRQLAERVWYPLWDEGYRLDHSVRTPSECRAVATSDLAAAVGLLDVTRIAGDADLVAATRQVIAHDWRAQARRRLPDLLAQVSARHASHASVVDAIDPDVKEGRGGLRDMEVVRAIAAAWLTDRPHGEVDHAYAVLLDVRDALHLVTGRGRSRLVREEQDSVAALLGHRDADVLMTQVVHAARTIAFALDTTARRGAQSQRARVLRTGPRRPRLTPLGYGCFEHDGEVVLGPGVPAGGLLVVLRAARLAAQRGLPLSRATLDRAAGGARPPRWDGPLRDAFVDLLATGPGLVQVWEALDLAGIINVLLPEWGAVRGRPQRGGVHLHTVDRHQVEAVVRADALRAEVSRPDLLVLAALLHDIGKVAGARDHSAAGAPVARSVVERIGLEPAEQEVIGRLVAQHLTLVDLATRRDVADPATVAALLDAVGGRRDMLDLLAALTQADALAAGPKAWTTWRAALVGEPVAGARRSLGDQRAVPVEPALRAAVPSDLPFVRIEPTAAGWRVEVVDRDRPGLFADLAGLLTAGGLLVRSARARTREGLAYVTWQVESPHDDPPAAQHLLAALRRLAAGDRIPLRGLPGPHSAQLTDPTTRAIVIPGACADATVLEVRSTDRPGLLHDLGRVLAALGLGVRSAHVATYAGQSLDTFYLTGGGGGPLAPPDVARLIGAVIDACDAVAGGDSPAR